jgi:hypothetical protein
MVQEMRCCEATKSSSLQTMWAVCINMPINYDHVAFANDSQMHPKNGSSLSLDYELRLTYDFPTLPSVRLLYCHQHVDSCLPFAYTSSCDMG